MWYNIYIYYIYNIYHIYSYRIISFIPVVSVVYRHVRTHYECTLPLPLGDGAAHAWRRWISSCFLPETCVPETWGVAKRMLQKGVVQVLCLWNLNTKHPRFGLGSVDFGVPSRVPSLQSSLPQLLFDLHHGQLCQINFLQTRDLLTSSYATQAPHKTPL